MIWCIIMHKCICARTYGKPHLHLSLKVMFVGKKKQLRNELTIQNNR